MLNKENFLFILLFLGGVLLPNNTASYIIIGISPLLLFWKYIDKSKFKFDRNTLLFFFLITGSFLTASFSEPGLVFKDILKYFSLATLFILFPFTKNVFIPNWVVYFALIFIVLSQIAFALGLGQIVNFIDAYYPYDGDKLGYNSEYLLGGAGDVSFITNRRYGGIYRNPNQAVRYVTLLFIVFLIENYKTNFIKKIPFILLVITSIILSGSRTGLLLTLGILFYSFYIYRGQIDVKKISLGVIIMCGLYLIYSFLVGFDLRIFEVSAGLDDSFASKFIFFDTFFNNLYSPLNFLIGHFSSENISFLYGVTQLDSEWGEMFYSFGILGCIILFLFYRKLFLLKDSNIRFFMLILLWGISSTILFSFKMGFLFMLLLSRYYAGYLQKNKNLR